MAWFPGVAKVVVHVVRLGAATVTAPQPAMVVPLSANATVVGST